MKQGEERTQFVKEKNDQTRKYIFQKNRKTKTAFYFILIVLALLIIAIALTGFEF